MKSLCVLEFYGRTKKRYTIIRNNRKYLENNIQPKDELISSLLSLNCITEEQSHFIQSQRSTRDKNYKLLYIMDSCDETKFSTFVNCLRRKNQMTVAKIIENGGGIKFKFYLKTLLVPYLYLFGLTTSLSPLLAPDKTARLLSCHLHVCHFYRPILRTLQCACLFVHSIHMHLKTGTNCHSLRNSHSLSRQIWVDGWMDGWMGGWVDGWMDG